MGATFSTEREIKAGGQLETRLTFLALVDFLCCLGRKTESLFQEAWNAFFFLTEGTLLEYKGLCVKVFDGYSSLVTKIVLHNPS